MTIEVYTGLPGGGKSYALAEIAMRASRNRLVFSNSPIRDTLRLDPDWLRSATFPAHSLLVIDEAGLVFNSREWTKLPQETYLSLAQHRKGGLDMVFAVQAPNRLDVTIRELCALWWECRAYRVPFLGDGSPVVYFQQLGYVEPGDLFSDRPPQRSRILFPRRKVYEAFDTYFMLDERIRQMVAQLPWDVPPKVRGSAKERFHQLTEWMRNRKGPEAKLPEATELQVPGAGSDVTGGVAR